MCFIVSIWAKFFDLNCVTCSLILFYKTSSIINIGEKFEDISHSNRRSKSGKIAKRTNSIFSYKVVTFCQLILYSPFPLGFTLISAGTVRDGLYRTQITLGMSDPFRRQKRREENSKGKQRNEGIIIEERWKYELCEAGNFRRLKRRWV